MREFDAIMEEAILDLTEKGYNSKEAAAMLSTSAEKVRAKILQLQEDQPVILQYRKLQNLHLTKLKVDILNSITPDDIAMASLTEKVKAYEILNKAELTDLGKPTEIKGILGYLLKIEEEKTAAADKESNVVININYQEQEQEEIPDI